MNGPAWDVSGFWQGTAPVLSVIYAKRAYLHENGTGRAAAEPFAPGLGEREAPYRAVFWRAYLGTRVYGVYDALRAAAECGTPGGGLPAARAGLADRRALDKALARLADELLVEVRRDGRRWEFDIAAALPALAPPPSAGLPRGLRAAHLDFLGLTPGFDLPAWWRRAEPSFVPLAVRTWGRLRVE